MAQPTYEPIDNLNLKLGLSRNTKTGAEMIFRLAENQHGFHRIILDLDNTRDVIQNNHLMNALVFSDTAVQRGIDYLRTLFSQNKASFTCYLADDKHSPFVDTSSMMLAAFTKERSDGNWIRHYFTQNLQTTNEKHNIDSGSSIKNPRRQTKLCVALSQDILQRRFRNDRYARYRHRTSHGGSSC